MFFFCVFLYYRLKNSLSLVFNPFGVFLYDLVFEKGEP